MRIGVVVVVGLAGLVACSGADDPPFTNCRLGQLSGTWRASYVETGGTCGAIADETVVLSAGLVAEAQSTCTYAANQISQDRCRIDQDFTCPLANAAGSQRWSGVTRQIAAGAMRGEMTVQVNGSRGSCRSSYVVSWTQL